MDRMQIKLLSYESSLKIMDFIIYIYIYIF
jgi:hypothetical protein